MTEVDTVSKPVDVEPSNVCHYVSLCGLKFEKLIWANPQLQKEIQYESMAPPWKQQDGIVDTLEEAWLFGFDYLGDVRRVTIEFTEKEAEEEKFKDENDEYENYAQNLRKMIKHTTGFIWSQMPASKEEDDYPPWKRKR